MVRVVVIIEHGMSVQGSRLEALREEAQQAARGLRAGIARVFVARHYEGISVLDADGKQVYKRESGTMPRSLSTRHRAKPVLRLVK